ncbi:MAG: ABC transporter ATP-binding protein [Nitrospinae bacterium]|nr:ABC transporter ATP-binding protein [Nitrospinota bacterium]
MYKGRIECSGVGKKYGDFTALKNVDLLIEAGDFLVLFGPNGAGKTTLLKILCGMTRPTSGVAKVGGADSHSPEIRGKIGVISHKSYLYDSLTAFENLEFYGQMYGLENPRARAGELLETVELAQRKDDMVRSFSRGMTQRLSIARALVADPDFIFLDEPFTGLDHHSAVAFQALLSALHKRGKTVLMITHDIPLGVAASTRVAILKNGRKVFDEKTDGLGGDKFMKTYLEVAGK